MVRSYLDLPIHPASPHPSTASMPRVSAGDTPAPASHTNAPQLASTSSGPQHALPPASTAAATPQDDQTAAKKLEAMVGERAGAFAASFSLAQVRCQFTVAWRFGEACTTRLSSSSAFDHVLCELHDQSLDTLDAREAIKACLRLIDYYVAAMQMLTAYVWGVAIKRCGVKPLLLMSTAVSAVANWALAYASTLSWALAIRFLAGLLICVSGSLKTLIAQSFPAAHQWAWLCMSRTMSIAQCAQKNLPHRSHWQRPRPARSKHCGLQPCTHGISAMHIIQTD